MDTRSREGLGRPPQENSCSLRVFFRLPESVAEILCGAIAPEAADIPSRRAAVKLGIVEGGLILEIEARDPVALRAALNSFLRFIDASLNVVSIVSPPSEDSF